jgi:hypothetical protein
MPVTSPDNIYYPSASDQVAPLESILAAMSSSDQTALINRFKTIAQPVPSASVRNSLFPTPVALNQVYRKDVGQIDRYNGSAWQTINEVFTSNTLSTATSIPASGTLGITGGVTLAAVPWARKVTITGAGTLTTINGSQYVDVVFRKDGNSLRYSRLNTLGTGSIAYAEILPANTSTAYQLVGTTASSTSGVFTNNGGYTYMTVETVAM